jgi:hypothetical protein
MLRIFFYPLQTTIARDNVVSEQTIGDHMKAAKSVDSQEPLTLSIPVAGAMAGIAKNAAYGAARRGEIPTIRLGGKLRVPAARWKRILAEGRDVSRSE